MSKAEEMILVVPRSLFDELGAFQGLNYDVEKYLPALLSRSNNSFTARSAAETNPKLKQIIPYIIFLHGDRILYYERGKKSGEQRLVAKGSIGIGGHMNDHDEGLFALDHDAYLAGVDREIREELNISGAVQHEPVALLNDDSNDVGQVHLGVVHLCRLDSDEVKAAEKAISQMEFIEYGELKARRESLETWSQFCCDHLPELLRRSKL